MIQALPKELDEVDIRAFMVEVFREPRANSGLCNWSWVCSRHAFRGNRPKMQALEQLVHHTKLAQALWRC